MRKSIIIITALTLLLTPTIALAKGGHGGGHGGHVGHHGGSHTHTHQNQVVVNLVVQNLVQKVHPQPLNQEHLVQNPHRIQALTVFFTVVENQLSLEMPLKQVLMQLPCLVGNH